MGILAATAIFSSLAGFMTSYRLLRAKTRKTRILAVLLLSILALPALSFSIYYFHVLPEKAWFYALRSWPGVEILAVFLGAAAGASAALIPRIFLILPLGISLAITVMPYLKPFINPLKTRDLKEQWKDEACLQSTESTCGPASTATILRFLGTDVSESEIAHAAYSSASGTEAWYLARYLRSQGFRTQFDFQQTFSPTVSLPAIVGVRTGGFGHFIAILKIDNETVTFADPLHGKQERKLSSFTKAYTFSGFHLSVTK
ncbi:MAG: cysteine peptidase family C39 domain-containing protein [Luteolibacter sp.]